MSEREIVGGAFLALMGLFWAYDAYVQWWFLREEERMKRIARETGGWPEPAELPFLLRWFTWWRDDG